jgi:hypothetical protein
MLWRLLGKDRNIALRELSSEQNSDRVIAIVGAAMLDGALREILEQRLRPSAETDINDLLFRPGAPLASTQPKIQLAYQLYALEKPERNAMFGLSQIRDIFVQHLGATFDFPDLSMSSAFANLILHESVTHYIDPETMRYSSHKIEDITSMRDLFTVNLKLSLTHLACDTRKHQQHSNIPVSSFSGV